MVWYKYEVIREDGAEGEVFEMEQSMKDPPLTTHPLTGEKVRKVYEPPLLAWKHTPGKVRHLTSNENLEKAGLTKYVRDKMTGRYHKVVGKDRRAPDMLDPR